MPLTVHSICRAPARTAASEFASKGALVIHVPIQFSNDYKEITQAVGVLATIKELGLFRAGQQGSRNVAALDRLECPIETVSGRTGFNAFRGTELDKLLRQRGIRRVQLAGASMAACIDSTARTAYELGYEVGILEDCVVSRSQAEHDLYCGMIFPQYSVVATAKSIYEPRA